MTLESWARFVWESMPARVSVAIESQMTIHPDSAEWVAVLRYDVIGGALDAIHLKMPAAWAAGVDLHLSDSEFQLTKETRGPDAFWTITPARPIWGSQRFVLKASRPLEPESAIVHPEIAPRGEGVVDAYLSIVNATGRPVTIENVVGLEKIPHGSKFQAREFAMVAGTAVGAFRVMQKSWALRVQSPRNVAGDQRFPATVQPAWPSPTSRWRRCPIDRSSVGPSMRRFPALAPACRSSFPPAAHCSGRRSISARALRSRPQPGHGRSLATSHRQSRIGLLWRTALRPHTVRLGPSLSPALEWARRRRWFLSTHLRVRS